MLHEHPWLPADKVNAYLSDRIGDHNVVIAYFRTETPGRVSTAIMSEYGEID